MSFLSIAYVSIATTPMSEQDIAEILRVSRANNARVGITGALIYSQGRFIQLLEGPEETVTAKYGAISTDPRHRNVHKLREQVVPDRQFAEWTMAFRPVSVDEAKQLDGFEDFFGRRGKSRIEHSENEAQQFLEWLAEYWLPKPR